MSFSAPPRCWACTFCYGNERPGTGDLNGRIPPERYILKRFRNRTWIPVGVLGAILALAGAEYFLPRRQLVAMAPLYERLAIGMTEAEVGTAVPIPPGDHTGGYVHNTFRPTSDGGLPIFVEDA